PPRRGQTNPSLAGLHWSAHLHRSYPENELGANVIGFVPYLNRMNNSGLYGVEEYYDERMAGSPLTVTVAVNPTRVEEIPNIEPGDSLILTLDREIQSKMETIIDQAVSDTGADSGTIIVMNPETGEILAMATTPRMNINEYWRYDEVFPANTAFNRAIGQILEPGSTFKVLTMAAALDMGAVVPSTTYYDDGWEEVGGINLHNWDNTIWYDQDMTGCMRHSVNTCLVWVAKQMGPTNFYDYMQRFGIGHRTNIDLAGEESFPLSLPGDPDWYQVNLGTNAFGQGVAVTPIRLIASVAAVANDGTMMTPHVLRAYIHDGRQYDIEPMPVGSPISAETARILSEMLAVSLEEEASAALVEGYRISGKTGTADIAEGEGWSDYTNASFIGWGPTDDPKFIVYVWLEKPKTDRWGSVVAAPVFQQAVEQLVVLLDLPPDSVRLQLK
ncbi:MAG TPA: penicillin-binding protein 2, partial [Anaerolineaceae bacterium]|nr:penicillin-binding protein 2 [Anaerolineaceae bacterium]